MYVYLVLPASFVFLSSTSMTRTRAGNSYVNAGPLKPFLASQ